MARAWHHVYSHDPDDQNAPHLEVEYRPGGHIEILAARDGAVVNLAGMPWEAFEQMVAVIRAFREADETTGRA